LIQEEAMEGIGTEMAALSAYVAGARDRELPAAVQERAALHTLDTLAAVISGSEMPAGVAGRRWAASVYGPAASGPATIIGAGRAATVAAALCNGMSAHADETDDSHLETHSHPGCAIVPAAVAAAQDVNASGRELLRAVAAGYDVGCRVGRAVGLVRKDMATGHRSSHALVGAFGATAASAVLSGLDEAQVRYALSYASQLTSGVTTWMRDTEHVEKAFVFAGMPASQGLLAVSLVHSGATGVADVFSGTPDWFEAVSTEPDPSALAKDLGSDYELLHGTLKKYSVGSPAQAAVEAVVEMMRDDGLTADGVRRIEIKLPTTSHVIVNNRSMPNINVQYLVAGTLTDGKFSFAMAHDADRMRRPDIVDLIGKTELVPDESIAGTREAEVTVYRDGAAGPVVHSRHIGHVRGTPALPMSIAEVRTKALDLIAGVRGQDKAEGFCDAVIALDKQPSVRELIAQLSE
jgi:2-methylcitrate dehydratase PrpD